MSKQDSRLALRLPTKERRQMDQLVQEGRFRDISDLTRQAIEKLLKENARE